MQSLENAQFRAVAGEWQGFGNTPREALEALTDRLPADSSIPIIIWPFNREDAFFSAQQQARLEDLKARRNTLSSSEKEEWEHLVEAAFDATIARTQTIQRVKS